MTEALQEERISLVKEGMNKWESSSEEQFTDFSDFHSDPSPEMRPVPPSFFTITQQSLEETPENQQPIVKTPDWVQGSVNIQNDEQLNYKNSSETYDFRAKHRRMEIIEIRILDGRDEQHIHPGYSPEIEISNPDLHETQFELEETRHYKQRDVRSRVPLFWPKRVWDTDDYQMDEAETETMRDLIDTASHPQSFEEFDHKQKRSKKVETPEE